MNRLYEKFTSRKFIACMIGVIVGVAVTFGIDGNTITDVAGVVVAFGSIFSYSAIEGSIDKEGVKTAVLLEFLEDLLGSDGASDTESP